MSLTPSPAILSIAVALLSLSQILLLFRFNALERIIYFSITNIKVISEILNFSKIFFYKFCIYSTSYFYASKT